jgi:hypothetical protein
MSRSVIFRVLIGAVGLFGIVLLGGYIRAVLIHRDPINPVVLTILVAWVVVSGWWLDRIGK